MGFLLEYHEELEADLLPGVDLLDVWRGRMSWRRLELLIRNLPPGGATMRRLAPEMAAMASWTHEAEAIKAIFDAYMQKNFVNPKPYQRPNERVLEQRRTEARHAALEAQAARVNSRA